VDEKKLLKYAVDYLSKYDSSKKNLSNVLKRKIFRLNIKGYEKSKLINNLDTIILKLEKNQLIDDQKYTNSKILSLSRAGKSKNYISNYLIKKGINKIEIQNNLKKFQEINNDWQLTSAKLFAKKKRLLESNLSYEKKLAKMARAGFSYDICKKIIG
tara:strand:+ start:1178 stop:1648 length:471 start_codon:yes stop_codon:yes gene_type:complete